MFKPMPVNEWRALMEFVGLVLVVVGLGVALVVLAVSGADDSGVTTTLSDAFKVLIGTISGLVWAARGGRRKSDSDGAPRG